MKKDENKKEFCTLTPEFPKQAYVTIVYITGHDENEVVNIYPLTSLSLTHEDVVNDVFELITQTVKEDRANIAEFCTIIPVTFESLYPLRKEFWGNPHQHYDDMDRLRLFKKAADKPELYKLLVTPSFLEETWTFEAALPFFISSPLTLIERFMLSSDWPVAQEAKFSAFYTFGKPLRFNWRTKAIIPQASEKSDNPRYN